MIKTDTAGLGNQLDRYTVHDVFKLRYKVTLICNL